MRQRATQALLGLAVLAGARGPTPDRAVDIVPGDATAFCARWSEARTILQDDFDRRDQHAIRSAVEGARHSLDEIGALVPASLRAD